MRALLRGDCLEILKTFPENSIHACVTDPPAGIEQDEKFFRIATGRIENARLAKTHSLFDQKELVKVQTISLFDEEGF